MNSHLDYIHPNGDFILSGTKNRIEDKDIVCIKKLWKFPVPTNYEINLLLKLLNDSDPIKIAIGLILVTGQRPIECTRVTWSRFSYDREHKNINQLYHETYKPINRIAKRSKVYQFKQVQKEIISKSKWLSELLINYRSVSPSYEHNRLLPFKSPDSINKFFSNTRKKIKQNELSPEYSFMLEKNIEIIKGVDARSQYRITPYSLRRFSITFFYWSKSPIGFNQDVIALSKYIGHSNPKTTYEHYIMPKESIGLTDQLINQKVTFDQFINICGAYQTQLTEYTPKKKYFFLEKGQSTLNQFQD